MPNCKVILIATDPDSASAQRTKARLELSGFEVEITALEYSGELRGRVFDAVYIDEVLPAEERRYMVSTPKPPRRKADWKLKPHQRKRV